LRYYTNVARQGGKILHRGYEDGRAFIEEIPYQPYLFLPSKNPNAHFKSLDGRPLEKVPFDDMWEMHKKLKEYEGVHNFQYYGTTNPVTTFIYDNYPGEIKFDPARIRIAYVDVELESLINGENFIERAPVGITTISLKIDGRKIAFGMKDFNVPKDVKYIPHDLARGEDRCCHRLEHRRLRYSLSRQSHSQCSISHRC
jgi:hypothetical protein